MKVCDLFVAVSRDRVEAFEAAGERESLRRRARELLKRAWLFARDARAGKFTRPAAGNHVR
jgi:hypothetical protein